MKRRVAIALLMAAMISVAPALYAIGVGGYFTTHYGWYRFVADESIKMLDSTLGGIDAPAPGKPVILGGGILWDSNLGKDELVNFRQHLGFDSHLKSTVKLTQFGLTNTLGFGVVRTGLLRFWLGPQLNLHYRWGKDAKNYRTLAVSAAVPPVNLWDILSVKRKYKYVTLGTGLALGLNINVHRNVAVAIEAGFQIGTSIWGDGKDLEPIMTSCWGYEGFITVSVLGRFKEPERVEVPAPSGEGL
ncbi:MAG TPA: hypothetical protein PK307_03905 [Spirochaetota bacterium]|nr:hypothetical protein [Spirochaetota bacterium]HOD16705.1 hypothetical protein [Spirochaetota bacterium]HPG50014.1 hypothetical protein [Spirochaetota bacterium]HPN10878.1 hypothetical protein [Spirochaetota bacterium]HQL81318.1 hypothetical protein [Spirochaetota bacterium]